MRPPVQVGAQAMGAYSTRITDPHDIVPALKRGLATVDGGKATVLEFITATNRRMPLSLCISHRPEGWTFASVCRSPRRQTQCLHKKIKCLSHGSQRRNHEEESDYASAHRPVHPLDRLPLCALAANRALGIGDRQATTAIRFRHRVVKHQLGEGDQSVAPETTIVNSRRKKRRWSR